MLVVFHKDDNINFVFKWLSFNKASDIFVNDPIASNNWLRADTKVYKFNNADYYKFLEIERNVNHDVFFSDPLTGKIGLNKIVSSYSETIALIRPDSPNA